MPKISSLDRSVKRVFEALVLLLALWRNNVRALDNGLALTPPMGFNTWEGYRCIIDCERFPSRCISEELIINIANEMKTGGYLDAGYNYLVIDDCWMADKRNENGDLEEDKTRFPSGMESLIARVKEMGLKFGIYENHGEVTCMGFPGTIGKYVKKDATLFAKWKVDFVKLDGCFTPLELNDKGYPEFGKYLNQSGQPIVYSCSWPYYMVEKGKSPNYTAVMENCNLWRNYRDIQDNWDVVVDVINFYTRHQDDFARFHGPGHWHDADMLIIGNKALTYEQAKSQMALWCVMGFPLFMSTNLMKLPPKFKEILLNELAISINQDPLGKMGRLIYNRQGIQILRKEITPQIENYSSYAVVIINLRDDSSSQLITKSADELGLYYPNGYWIEDVFQPGQGEHFNLQHTVSAEIKPNCVAFWRFTVLNASAPHQLPTVSRNSIESTDAFTNPCKEKTALINLPDRTPYSVDLIGVIYVAVVLVMLFIMIKSRVGVPRRHHAIAITTL